MKSYQPSDQALEAAHTCFTFHPVQPGQAERYEHLRGQARELAKTILTLTPPSREQSVALTNLQQAVMWANAAIAIHESPSDLPDESDHIVKAEH